ncbi:MAG: hypothetical protein WAM85_06780, partial [Terracidiphilus sp.]
GLSGSVSGPGYGSLKDGGLSQPACEDGNAARSSWQSFLASAGMFATDLDRELPEPSRDSTVNTPMMAHSSASGKPLTEDRSPAASKSGMESSARFNVDTSPRKVGMQETRQIATAPADVIQPKFETHEPGDPVRSDHARKVEKTESTKTAGANTTLEGVTGFPPVAAPVPATTESPVVSARDQSRPSFGAEEGSGRFGHSVGLLPQGSENRIWKSATTGTGGEPASDGMNGVQSQKASSADSSPDTPRQTSPLSPAEHLFAADRPVSGTVLDPNHGSPSVANGDAGLNSSLASMHQEATRAPISEALTSGRNQGTPDGEDSIARSAAQSGGTKDSHSVAGEALHSATQSHLSAQDHMSMSPIQGLSGMQAAPSGGKGGSSESGTPPGGNSTIGVHETFAALDAESGAVAPAWIHAGPHQAEAGYQDQDLGWVGVRAQMDSNGIRAALVPGSADAAQVLSGHLAGLSSYLTDHHTPVGTLTMSAPESHSVDQGVGQGNGQNSGQGNNPEGYSNQQTGSNPHEMTHGTTRRSIAATSSGGSDIPLAGVSPGGVYISVMA